jgi:transketolase
MDMLIADLNNIALELRQMTLKMIYIAQSGHPGGSLSSAEIITALFFHKMNIDPHNRSFPDRDRFILSKGHAAPILYAALAKRGYFPLNDLDRLRQMDSHLQGHPDRLKTPGIEMTSGVLGHGPCIGVGLALAARINHASYRTYVLVGDGEMQAGVAWEGVMAGAKYSLDNLTIIMDCNGVQLDGYVEKIMPIEPIEKKWLSFGWNFIEIDGHNMREILEALDEIDNIHDQPTVVLARTIKGKGISFMENRSMWHGRAPTMQEYKLAMAEIDGNSNV